MPKSRIPLHKPSLGEVDVRAVLAVLEADLADAGAQTEAFERTFAQWIGSEYAVATDSGTSALLVALLAHEIGPGDEVVTTSFTSLATVNAILAAGATPVFVDIQPDTYNLDVDQVEGAISERTKAIIPVHLFGHMCDMDALMRTADKDGLVVVEDAGQAMGARFGEKLAGTFGTGAFSLSTTSAVTSLEGGVITTDQKTIAERCRMIRDHGLTADGKMITLGLQFGLSDLHAALALSQMSRIEELIQRRRQNAAYLNSHLKLEGLPVEKDGFRHVWHTYTLCLPEGCDRENIIQSLEQAGIETDVYYPQPVYNHNPVRKRIGEVYLPQVEEMSKCVLSLPVHSQLAPAERQTIVKEVNRVL
jgi:dTDP-4-amino-4,6-dideoxygalactose transaminase